MPQLSKDLARPSIVKIKVTAVSRKKIKLLAVQHGVTMIEMVERLVRAYQSK
jgi:flavorubredoxin